MATTTKLVMVFGTTVGDKVTLSYNHVKSNTEATDIQDLAAGIIANGSIFAKVPVIATSAKLVTTTETEVELED